VVERFVATVGKCAEKGELKAAVGAIDNKKQEGMGVRIIPAVSFYYWWNKTKHIAALCVSIL
jgi:hypothetical protein